MTGRVLAALVAMTAALSAAQASDCARPSGAPHTIAEIVDGRTILLEDGQTIVLAGLEAPRPEDAKRTLSNLIGMQPLNLASEPHIDRHGRLIAQAFLDGPQGPVWLQGQMLDRGLARVLPDRDDEACLAALLKREMAARAAGQGIWADARYQVLRADDPAALTRLKGTFQIVEGTVLSVSDRTARLYINFGEDWRSDFTVTTDGRTASSLKANGFDPLALEGKRIRIRGWIDEFNGPQIELTTAGQIELLDTP